MKINEVLIREDEEEQQNLLQKLNMKAAKNSWKNVQADKQKEDVVFTVRGVEFKGYIDYNDNLFYVMDTDGVFKVADTTFTRQAFRQNTSARLKDVLNMDPSWKDKLSMYFDPTDPTKPGAGQAMAYADKKGLHRAFGIAGSRLGGHIDNWLAKRKDQKQLGDIWQQTYGVEAPKPGDAIVFKTTDGKVFNATMIQLRSGVDADGDGVPDLQIKGNFDPSNPKKVTTTGIGSSQVLSIKGKKLVPQSKINRSRTNTTNIANDPADAGMNPSDVGDPAAI